MRKGGVGPSTASRTVALLVKTGILLSVISGPANGQGLISGNYSLNWDQNVAKSGTTTTDTKTFKHVLEMKYKGFLSPVVENEIVVKVEQEIDSSAEPRNVVKVFPTINLAYKGSYWNAGAKRTIEDSNLPDVNRKVADSYFVELFIVPRKKELPDFKGKYTLDKDFQAELADTARQGITLSSLYKPNEWLEAKGDYNKNLTTDYLRADADTKDDKLTGLVGIRHMVSAKIKVQTEYKLEIARSATVLSGGGTTNAKEDQVHTWKNLVGFRPFRDTDIGASYDIDLKQNIATGEHANTKNLKTAASQRLGKVFDVRGDFSRIVTEARHTLDDNEKVDDTWTGELKAKFSRQLDFGVKYQKKTTREEHADSSRNATSGSDILSGTWTGELTPFWKASALFDRTDTFTNEVKTAIDTKYSLLSTFDFKALNLTLDPSYDVELKEDLATPLASTTRDFKFKIAYKPIATRNVESKIEHTFGRKTDSGAGTIQRTDSTSGTLGWKEPMPGWNATFDVTRAAEDTSGDGQQPNIVSTFGVKGDYKHHRLTVGTSFKFDKKTLTDDSETFNLQTTWTAPQWDLTLSYTFTKTLSETLSEGYTIGLAFKYNL